jgi:hypothetical protein
MRMEMRGEVIIGLCLCMLLFFCPVPQAADYTYGDYYNKQLTTTSTGNTRGPSINGKGDKIAFSSDQDLLGNGSAYPQLFLWSSTSGLTQITSDVCYMWGWTNGYTPLPSINFAGDRIAYRSFTNFWFCETDIKLWKSEVGSATTIVSTGCTWPGIDPLKISGNGKKVYFRSNEDFKGVGNNYNALYLWDEDTSAITKIDTTQSLAALPDIYLSGNYDGTLAAYSTICTTGSYAGKNPDANWETYLWNKSDNSISQITSTSGGGSNGGCREPSITSYTISTTTGTTSMTKIAFSSDRDLLTSNPDNNPEIFLWTIYGSYTSTNTGSYTQITSTSVSGGACRNPQISRDGKFVTFTSNVDIVSGGISLLTGGTSAIFVWNANGVITQVNTNSSDNPVIASYTGLYESGDIQYGPRIAYFSTSDGSEEIYLATSTIPVPATSRWGLIILILVLVSLAVFMLIRKRRGAPEGKLRERDLYNPDHRRPC